MKVMKNKERRAERKKSIKQSVLVSLGSRRGREREKSENDCMNIITIWSKHPI